MIVCLSPNGPMVHSGEGPAARVLVATTAGVETLARDGEGWRRAGLTLEGRHVSALMVEPTRGGVFAGVHGEGVYRSDDGGQTWEPASDGIDLPNIFSLNCNIADGAVRLFAGSEPVCLFRSLDYGESWEAFPDIGQMPGREKWTFPAPPHVAHLKSIALDPWDPDVLYGCIEQGALMKSADGGRTWRELDAYAHEDDRWYHDIHKVVPLASNADEVLMSTGVGLYRSADGGETWGKLTGPSFEIGYPDHLIVSPFDEETVFVAGAADSPDVWRATKKAMATVLKSVDGGRTWAPASQGLPQRGRAAIEAMSLAAEPGRFTLFLGNTDGEVYESRDGAQSWTCIASGLAPVSKSVHAANLRPAAV
ncbi:MAG: sialidase family protein [Caulobacteraceae bacterium]